MKYNKKEKTTENLNKTDKRSQAKL